MHHDYYRCVKTRTDFSFFFRCHHGYVRCCDGECCFCAYSPRIFAALRCVQTRLFSGRVHHDYYRCVKTRTDFSFFFRCHHGYVRCCDGECCFCAYSPRIFAALRCVQTRLFSGRVHHDYYRCVKTRTDFSFFFPLSPWLRAVLRR